MKIKSPDIYSFAEMYEEYSQPQERKFLRPIKDGSRMIIYEESPQMKERRLHVLELLEKHQKALNEIEMAMVEYNQQRIIEYPQVSPVLFKSIKEGSDGEYYNARVIWPLLNNQKQELRIYLGKKSEFPDFDDPETTLIAQQKISMALKNRKLENRLPLTKEEYMRMKEK
jgi:hypothetical protein